MSDFIFINMILLERGTTAFIALTLEDGYVTEGSGYLFEFTNDLTGEVVSVSPGLQPSQTERWFAFSFIVNTVFNQNKNNGYWTYELYEVRSIPVVKRLIKRGKMKLIGETTEFTQYDGQDNEFIAYNS